eukprot:jgi/Mesvir1/2392/Mv22137-RA.1
MAELDALSALAEIVSNFEVLLNIVSVSSQRLGSAAAAALASIESGADAAEAVRTLQGAANEVARQTKTLSADHASLRESLETVADVVERAEVDRVRYKLELASVVKKEGTSRVRTYRETQEKAAIPVISPRGDHPFSPMRPPRPPPRSPKSSPKGSGPPSPLPASRTKPAKGLTPLQVNWSGGGNGPERTFQLPRSDWSATLVKQSYLAGGTTVNCAVVHGERLFLGAIDNTIKVLDVKGLTLLATLEGHELQVVNSVFSTGVSALAVSASLNLLFSGGEDGAIKVWDLGNLTAKATLSGHGRGVTCLATEGERLVSGSMDHSVRVWSLPGGEPLATLSGHQHRVNDILLVGDVIFSCSSDKYIKSWSLSTLSSLASWRAHTERVRCLALCGGKLLSASDDETIRVWEMDKAERGKCQLVTSLEGHSDCVNVLAPLPDGTFFSGAADGSILAWQVSDHSCVGFLDGHELAVTALALVADRHLLFSCGVDKLIKVWRW